MSYLIEGLASTPTSSDGRSLEFIRLVKIFEGSNMPNLEVAINNFLNSLRTTYGYVTLTDIMYLGAQGSSSRVLVSYGYFQPSP